jgi:hypothetical protein
MNSHREGTGFVTVTHGSPVRIETPVKRALPSCLTIRVCETTTYGKEDGLAPSLPSFPSNGTGHHGHRPEAGGTSPGASTEDGETK